MRAPSLALSLWILSRDLSFTLRASTYDSGAVLQGVFNKFIYNHLQNNYGKDYINELQTKTYQRTYKG